MEILLILIKFKKFTQFLAYRDLSRIHMGGPGTNKLSHLNATNFNQIR